MTPALALPSRELDKMMYDWVSFIPDRPAFENQFRHVPQAWISKSNGRDPDHRRLVAASA